MYKVKAIRFIFLTIFLILSITLFLMINALTSISLIDDHSDQKERQLSKSAKNSEIKSNSKNTSKIALLETKEESLEPVPNKLDTDVQNIVSRGISNRSTYDNIKEAKKPAKATTTSSAPPEASPNTIPQAVQSAQPQTDSKYENNLDLLARLITAEAQGEPYDAKVAVGAVVINRLESGLWATTIKDVIYQKINGYYQFTPVVNGWINKPAEPESIEAAKAAIRGVDPTNGAQFYYDDNCTNEWILSKPISLQIGHMIYAY